ncbi:MAG TPA: SRPBCC family protein [Ferruginibacter sp.]|nr:SRPBCC family protein [Ferruginibacter sp.]
MKNSIKGEASVIIDAPSSKVWEALTTPEIIKQYFFGTDAASDWKAGSPITFSGEWEGKHYEDKGTILEVVPNKLFRYNYWSSMSGIEDKPENYVIITYALLEENNNTTLTITQENIPDEKMKDHSEQNWKKVLADLKKLLETETVTSE